MIAPPSSDTLFRFKFLLGLLFGFLGIGLVREWDYLGEVRKRMDLAGNYVLAAVNAQVMIDE